MKKIYQLLSVVMMLGAVPMLTSCDEIEDNPVPVIHISGITLTAEGAENGEVTMVKGSTLQLVVKITPADTKETDVKWKSSKKSVATISDDGLVTAKKIGTTTITVTSKANSSISAELTITVKKEEAEEPDNPDNPDNPGNPDDDQEPIGLDDEDPIDQSLAQAR